MRLWRALHLLLLVLAVCDVVCGVDQGEGAVVTSTLSTDTDTHILTDTPALPESFVTVLLPPYAYCDATGETEPYGFVFDLLDQLNDAMRTDYTIECRDMSFDQAVAAVSDNEYAVFLNSVSLNQDRVVQNIRYSVPYHESGIAFAVPCDKASSDWAMIEPISSPVAVNVLSLILLSHLVLANLMYVCEWLGSRTSRREAYSSKALLLLWLSVLGWDLVGIKTAGARLLAFLDTLIAAILMALYLSAVTVESVSNTSLSFDTSDLEGVSIGIEPDNAFWVWMAETGADNVEYEADVFETCLDDLLISNSPISACAGDKDLINHMVKEHSGDVCVLPQVANIQGVYSVVSKDLPGLTKDINVALVTLMNDGRMDYLVNTLIDKECIFLHKVTKWAIIGFAAVAIWLIVMFYCQASLKTASSRDIPKRAVP
ncbi:hypothetical protein KIPB_000172 [Kipferlia bialata]|uniref:Solute-binding protein family 3/N-terminal domain-containing protein n=1 Tax=Kipferlia bialata TaxID=797122 RepID=A0A9K3CQ36_9EUKA|nr:hypothetical protein KIPB_000172 [Kipferlia bialata]|eukprot:g172.t1